MKEQIDEFTKKKGANIILDCVGSSMYNLSEESLALDSRWVIYGLMGGAKINQLNLAKLMAKRVQISFSTLKTRSDSFKT